MYDKQARGLRIRGKIALGYFLILLMLGLFLIIVSTRITSLEKETVFLSDHDMRVHELTYQIEKSVLDMETGQRGYALTGDVEYLTPYNNGMVKWRIAYAELTDLIADNPAQLQTLNTIEENIEKWIREAGEHVVNLKQLGQNAAVSAYFQKDPGKTIIDFVRTQSEFFRENERTLTMDRIINLKDSNQKLLIMMYILWSLVAVMATLITFIISGMIIKPLGRVIQAIYNIASGGNMSERIVVRTHDEIYELGEATNLLLNTVQQEQWSSEQLNSMALVLQETTDLPLLCRIFVNKLAIMLEMQYGSIYVLDKEDTLKLAYAYAGSKNSTSAAGTPAIAMGEGLVGQCALDKRVLVLEDLPPDFIIHSGLGRTAPRYGIIAPVVFENRTLAVLEIASLTKWAAHHQDLLNQLLKMMGISLNSVITRMEIQKLYSDSQVMNEELQVQSEELQVQSEELQDHTHELMELNNALQHQKAVAESAAADLERYNKQLELSSKYKTEFLANMSHELRTPLNSMLILSQLLAENRSGTLTEEEQNYASVIHSSGSDLLGMINDILDLSKVEAGKMLVELDAVNLTELPSLLQGYFAMTAEQKSLEFTIEIAGGVPDLFFTDEMRLHQILRNILSNAFKFTEKGSVHVTLSKLDQFHSPQYSTDEPVLAFAVKDSGIGISEDKLALIFEAFHQADGTTARKYGGTGLGLSISLQLARLLEGHIDLSSTLGKGSTFTLILPCREKAADAEPAPGGARAEASAALDSGISRSGELFDKHYAQLQGKRVLIVDDDARNIYALNKGLEPYDMDILTAQTGFECLQVIREQPDVDIVLLDIMMPHLDGYDTLSIIREELELQELPIIAISAKTMKEDREKCLAAGATDFIRKPVDLKEVVSGLYRWLSAGHSRTGRKT
ncbi:histidine kinase [Paenibacillus albidus]|uniref:Circadian input-output histidine kinase CikA n=1 Tax=Paenibacillus albidus TaxID=2041023 RepID=A0A917C1X3_9BACL|nr:CHASE3 domain-containing protein [Paenibacillus albidus]MBT2290919.1 CHASE3 domain-containing protein [Paenibacillus albidus]GGF68361.1 histidine kinase [Paenibacillus albidus]